MLKVILCLGGVAAILGLAELLWRKKIITGEVQRKFTHIGCGVFIAFWPWLISWKAIGLIGIAMFAGVVTNRLSDAKFHHYSHGMEREGYGDIYFALAVILCAAFTDMKIFFALAILHLALADGLAAIVGKKFGKKTKYTVMSHTKSLVGSMMFWFISLCLLGGGVLYAYHDIGFSGYIGLLLLMPPILTLLENFSGYGLDNLTIPLAVLAGLYIAI